MNPKETIRPSRSHWWIPRLSLSDKTHHSYNSVPPPWRVALARLMDHPSARGNWIENASPDSPYCRFANWRSLPTRESIQNIVLSQRIHEYYIPQPKKIRFRQTISVWLYQKKFYINKKKKKFFFTRHWNLPENRIQGIQRHPSSATDYRRFSF